MTKPHLIESVEPDYSTLSAHPLAGLMPMMDEQSFELHKADIKRNGLREQIVLYQGAVLDGRNRLKALRALGITLTAEHFKEWSGTSAEAEAYVISTNLHRRQLNNKQKQEFAQAMILKYPTATDRALGRLTSLSKNTIKAARDAMSRRAQRGIMGRSARRHIRFRANFGSDANY
jgi:hypothetical protein